MTRSLDNNNTLLNKPDFLTANQQQLAAITLLAIFLLNSALYAFLMLRDDLPLVGLVLLGVLWLVYLIAYRGLSHATPMDMPILGLLILLPLNLIVSAAPQLTLVRVYHLLLSFSIFFTIVRLVHFRKHIPMLIFSMIALALGMGVLGLLATHWSEGILRFLTPIYEALPQLNSLVPGASINKNTMGGALTFFPPLLLSLLWDSKAFQRLSSRYTRLKKFPIWLYKLLLLLTFVLVIAVLFLTQSRGAWLGTAVGLFIFLVWKDKCFLLAIPLGALAVYLLANEFGLNSLSDVLNLLDQGQDASLQSRLDIWARVISVVRDFPITGVGLDALSSVYPIYFNPFLFDEPPVVLYHAHNSFLSVAIEMGIPALVLYVALLSSFVAMAWYAWKGARTINRVLIMGLVCGVVSHQVFGLMDAYPLGKNLGITTWVYFAVVATLFIHKEQMIRSHPRPQTEVVAASSKVSFRRVTFGLAAWLLLTLLALTLCQMNIYICLIVAVLVGGLLGCLVTKGFVSPTSDLKNIAEKLKPKITNNFYWI